MRSFIVGLACAAVAWAAGGADELDPRWNEPTRTTTIVTYTTVTVCPYTTTVTHGGT